ncbi:uncharacterized protein HMPREF1541_06769 [Cyphellophora europaea CBS 101466]|uniref:2-hydroxyacyl-CoA lyase n=1 Tax=Cyphellophora europaea (strain CBS 101466) TaxID=1220924 RepID=W2RQC1_CYPE1|nr:uncharacterized protein HMPREF1541_06769 [Cyphellophora europaea CBS 101466]ETN38731.1 hypothetical protein HMPREF1541_06769 [Cyphellophora europaea CBS 101466]
MVYGAKIIAQALQDLGVQVIFGLPGLPVIDIAQESMNLGINFISFRNEQAAVLAASSYGYLTGKPGVCICVGGPGVLNTFPGIPHAAANCWPLLLLGGSSETHNANKGAFQEMDALPIFSPHAKLALRPPYPEMVPSFVRDAYRAAMFGRPGPAFVDLPANIIMGHFDVERHKLSPLLEAPKAVAPPEKIRSAIEALKTAKAPLVVVGKGAAYGRAEKQIQALIERTGLPFLPTPMGKGVVPDASPHNISAARSTAMKTADVVLLLGARLNWILTFGLPPKWKSGVKIIQVDISADELGKNGHDPSLSIVGDLALVVEQLVNEIGNWRWQGQSSEYYRTLQAAKSKNEEKAAKKASAGKIPMAYEKAFGVIQETLNSLSTPNNGDIVYVSEGAKAMDISRSIFTMEHPRIRLDAGTYATMGVGPAYAIAAYAAYNYPHAEGSAGTRGRKKIVAIEGDSAFGFSAMEVETMGRYRMDVLIFVINNSGLYRGDADSKEKWQQLQDMTVAGSPARPKGLSATSLGYETDYQKIAEVAGGIGLVARTPEELKEATIKGFQAKVPVVVNVIVDTQTDLEMDFSWLDMAPPTDKKKKEQKL